MCRLAQARRSQKAVVSNFLRNLAADFSHYICEQPEMTSHDERSRKAKTRKGNNSYENEIS